MYVASGRGELFVSDLWMTDTTEQLVPFLQGSQRWKCLYHAT